jgi:hypothetical protein
LRNSESQTDADTDKRLREIAFVLGDDADPAANLSVAAGAPAQVLDGCERRRVRRRSDPHQAVLGQTLEPDRVSLPAAMGIVKIKNPLAAR